MRQKFILILTSVKEWSVEQVVGLIAAMLAGLGLPKLYEVLKSVSSDKKEVEVERIKTSHSKEEEYFEMAKQMALMNQSLNAALERANDLKKRLFAAEEELKNTVEELRNVQSVMNSASVPLKMIAVVLRNDEKADPKTIALLDEAMIIFDEIAKSNDQNRD